MTKIKPDNFVFNGQSGLFRNRKLKILQKVRLIKSSMTSFYPVQFFAEDEPAPSNFEEQPAQPVQPVQLNTSSQELLAYLTGMKSLLHLFDRG